MPAIKKYEVMTPLRGLCDTFVKGDGIIDFSGPTEGCPGEKNYISIGLDFYDEAEIGMKPQVYAEINFTNNYESLIEEGVDPEVAGLIVASADLFAKAMKQLIYRGGKYGG